MNLFKEESVNMYDMQTLNVRSPNDRDIYQSLPRIDNRVNHSMIFDSSAHIPILRK
jgi:hypothetical protein